MSTYSASRLSTFEHCPRKFRYRYIEKIERADEQSIEAFTGSLVHETLEKLYKDLSLESHLSLEAALAYFDRQWKKQWNGGISIVRENVTPEQYKDLGHRCITRYYERHAPFDRDTTLGLERRITFPLDADGKWTIEGYIDRLSRGKDGILEIHDYKTGAGNLPTRSELREDRQLALYTIGVREEYGNGAPIRAIWHYLAFGEDIAIDYTPQDLERTRAEAIALITSIETATHYPTAKSASLCPWCEYRDICPAMKHAEKLDSLTPIESLADTGRHLVDTYMERKEQLDALENSIKADRDRLNAEIHELKEALAAYARDQDMELVAGTRVKIRVKWYPQVDFPDWRVREDIAALLAAEGHLMSVAGVDSKALANALENKTLPADLIARIAARGVTVKKKPYLYPSKR